MELDFVHRLANEARLVLDDLDLNIGWQRFGDALQALQYMVGDLHGVGSRLALHEQADGVLPIQSAQAARLFDGVLRAANVFDADREALARGDDQIVEFVRRLNSAQRPQHEFARALLHDAAGHLHILRNDGRAHVLDR